MSRTQNQDRNSQRNEVSILRRIGYDQHTTVEQAWEAGGGTALEHLMRDGSVIRDPGWTGCVILTDEGRNRLDGADAETGDMSPGKLAYRDAEDA